MAQAITIQNYNTFVRGLITEANPLTFPEDASVDEANFVLNSDGSRQRRLGIDYETGYQLSASISESYFDSGYITSHIWSNAGNDNLTTIVMVQTGEILRFYKVTGGALSSSELATTIDISTYERGSLVAANYPVSSSYGLGRLYVVSQAINPLRIDYNPSTGAITVTEITIEIRDFYGVDDGLDTDENPSTLSATHKYNLLNQGWTTSKIDSYKSSTGSYPSNAQIWVYGKDSNDDFSPSLLDKQSFGNTYATKGHHIVDAFDIDRDSIVTGAGEVVDSGRPSTVTFFSGRVFYAGVSSDITGGNISNNGNIFFSQIVDDPDKSGRCYQESDPTSEDISELLPNDGGIINIPDAGNIQKLLTLGNYLVIVSDNGVWAVIGGAGFDTGFSADDYQVTKVSNFGAINSVSVVDADGAIVYWSDTGIFLIKKDGTNLTATDISFNTIKKFYTAIPSISRLNAWGTYDSITRKISWLYNDGDSYNGTSYRNKYTKELILDTNLQAFYKYEISSLDTNSPFIISSVTTPSLVSVTTDEDVVHPDPANPTQNTQVVAGANGDVVTPVESFGRAVTSTRYLTAAPDNGYKITFSQYKDTEFLDWQSADSIGVDYDSYLITGQEIFKDSARKKQVVYMTCNFKRTEIGYTTDDSGNLVFERPSGCLIQARWDFSDSSASNKYGTQFKAYRLRRPYFPTGSADTFDYGYDVITTKNKVRGSGKAVSFYITSETGKDMHLLGWTLLVTGNTAV